MHGNVLAWTGFCIKQKSQDTYLHHTSLVQVVGHWNHSLLLKELTEIPLCFVGGAKVKIPLSYNEGGIYNQGWYLKPVTFILPSWLFKSLWILNRHDSSYTCVFIRLPLYITIHMAHNSDLAFDNSWHDLTWHYGYGLACWGGNFRLLFFLGDRCVLWWALSSPPRGLMMRGLQWSSVLRVDCMNAFPFLLLDKLPCPFRCVWVF